MGVRLEEIDQSIIVTAQAVPKKLDAGGAESIGTLTDRVWSKAKTSAHRVEVSGLRGEDLADWDWDRLAGRQAVASRREKKRVVTGLVAMSLKDGHLAAAEFRKHRIKALVRAKCGHDAYLAIIAEGVPDPQMFALHLDCVPDVAPEDWQREPSPIAEMESATGEMSSQCLTDLGGWMGQVGRHG
jgi:hypothetical protein